MLVADTSAWIEWLAESQVGEKVGEHWPDKDQCVVPTIVQMELSKWLTREVSAELSNDVVAHTQECVVVPLDTEIAVLAADLSRRHKLSTADAIIYATAQARSIELLTCDADFEGLPGVVYLAKAGRQA